jgi:hypothetical protein
MADGLTPLVAFPLVAFAALAVPSAIAFVLFGIVRKDPPGPTTNRPRIRGRMRVNRKKCEFGRTGRRFR